MREKGQTEAAKTLETPVFSRGIEILTEKLDFLSVMPVHLQVKNLPHGKSAQISIRDALFVTAP